MSAITTLALPLVKARLNRLTSDTSIDNLLSAVIAAVEVDLSSESGALIEADPSDLLLLVDASVWQYQSRDKMTGRPEWLRYRLKQRFLRLREVIP